MKSAAAGPLISLCLIARDEEQMLPGCLASVRGVVDEIVAADTGSTDRTRALLDAAGARVIDFPWCDDFAAARNAVLAQARGRYVLVLDADERLGAQAGKRLRKAAEEARVDCGLLPLHHASRLDAREDEVLSGRARLIDPVLLPRFLRRAADLAWEGVVHENVGSWLQRPGRVIRRIEAPIVHLGAVPEWRAARNKRQRNLSLLEARCRQEATSPVPRAYLAHELLRDGQIERARAVVDEALELMVAARGRGEPLDPTQVLTLHAYAMMTSGALPRARRTLELAAEWGCEHANFDFLRGALLEHESLHGAPETRTAAARAACAALESSLAKAGQISTAEGLPGATGFAAATRLGHLRLRLGEFEPAAAAFGAALRDKADHLPAELGLIELRIERGDAAGALAALEPLLTRAGPDGWYLAALACRQLGQLGDARLFLQTCLRERAKAEFAAPHRALGLAACLASQAA